MTTEKFKDAIDNVNLWYTATGNEIRPELEDYFETYRERFLEILDACVPGGSSNDFSEIFTKADQHSSIGDFLGDDTAQYPLLAAFGLVLFDRINSDWDILDKAELFFLHEQIFECFDLCGRRTIRKEDARMKALKGHSKRRMAKGFVISEWEAHREAYGYNKSAFARDYTRRVFHEYSISVTEKQMREVWLLDALPASKPDGLQADGE